MILLTATGSDCFDGRSSKVLAAVLFQAGGTVLLLLGVGIAGLVQPFLEHVLVLLEQEELTEHSVRLVETKLRQSVSENRTDAGKVRYRLLSNRLGDEISVLLRRRHLLFG